MQRYLYSGKRDTALLSLEETYKIPYSPKTDRRG